MQLTVHTNKPQAELGDLFGIFFEDINHAADGGLYGELVQNRAFEFCSMDNAGYRPLTAWEKVEACGRIEWHIASEDPISEKNPHYLVVDVVQSGSRKGIRNLGFNGGISIEVGKEYLFSCYARCAEDSKDSLQASITNADGESLCGDSFEIDNQWKQHHISLTAPVTERKCRLEILILGDTRVDLDFISLFPKETFKARPNGLRRDIAEMLGELKPKFMRFPGGCLVHDGSLNPDDRDSMYRWKNTVGDIISRPARRNNWQYNQTLGLGYFEYFQFCEDIGTKPLPVIPAGHNPHAGGQSTLLDSMQPWIDEALDLIEFAVGDADTRWGKLREEMGHPAPFNLEYLAIGNEEVEKDFFTRYEIIHKAVKKVYPQMKLINSAGPFCAGEAYDMGWASSEENGSELIDEHYYQTADWFIANHDRYMDYDSKTKVFVGEYASKGNAWYNALAEAVFMIGLEKSAHAVGLACYAPLLCNADYINWKPDLIWFNDHQVYGTANYYVQKLFMNHQGEQSLACTAAPSPEKSLLEHGATDRFAGKLCLSSNRSIASFSNITLENSATREIRCFEDVHVGRNEKQCLTELDLKDFSLKFNAKQTGDGWGFDIFLGMSEDEQDCYGVHLGSWDNHDAFIVKKQGEHTSIFTQKSFHIESDRLYEVELIARGRELSILVDGEMLLTHTLKPMEAESLYYTASKDSNGDIILKLANAAAMPQSLSISLDGITQGAGTAYVMEGFALDAENSFEYPDKVSPVEKAVVVTDGNMGAELPPYSLQVIRLRTGK